MEETMSEQANTLSVKIADWFQADATGTFAIVAILVLFAGYILAKRFKWL